MKKFFIIFLLIIVLSLSLVLPCFAVMTDSFGSYTNLFDPSDVSFARFYTDINSFESNYFYTVNLQANQTYTFISTEGTRRLYLGQSVLDSENFTSLYSFDSYNLSKVNSFTVHVPSGASYVEYLVSNPLPAGTYNISYEVDSPVYNLNSVFGSGSSSYLLAPTYRYITSSNRTVSGTITITQSMVDQGRNYIYIRPIEGAAASNVTVSSLKIFLSDSSNTTYIPSYVDPFYVDESTYVYEFTPVKSGTYYIGISDSLYLTNNLFSVNQSDENQFYLFAGSLPGSDISDILANNIYNSGFDSGYTQGYKEGEYDGMNSSGVFKSVLLTVLSAPFVFVSNALDFEIFGVNLYLLIKVILTILIVAFLITRLKGRE